MMIRQALTAEDCERMGAAAIAEAEKNNWNVSIAICDDGGHPLWFKRLNGAPPISAYIASNKAKTAALGRRETRLYEEVINNGRTAFLTVPEIEGLLEGGVPVVVDGVVIGAVGVSNVKSNEDAQIAKAGIAAL
ncbi:MAG: hypothetical protein RLZZ290_899 [Pseudomonadota bacterium]|jgi:uncharacterized protein GlcG (DUF336 family)